MLTKEHKNIALERTEEKSGRVIMRKDADQSALPLGAKYKSQVK
jgi:hypothetical protein